MFAAWLLIILQGRPVKFWREYVLTHNYFIVYQIAKFGRQVTVRTSCRLCRYIELFSWALWLSIIFNNWLVELVVRVGAHHWIVYGVLVLQLACLILTIATISYLEWRWAKLYALIFELFLIPGGEISRVLLPLLRIDLILIKFNGLHFEWKFGIFVIFLAIFCMAIKQDMSFERCLQPMFWVLIVLFFG